MKKPRYKKNNSGFIALISAVIISIILLLMITNTSLTSFYSRSNILDYELKALAKALAEGCADTAILRLIEDPIYSGSETVPIGGDTCSILSVTTAPSGKTILVAASYKNYVTNLKIVVQSTDMSVISWEEI
jgi:hypothetical protein